MRLTVLLVHLVLAALPSPLLAKPTLSSFTSVDCSDIEGSTELCRHCRRAFEAAYPLTPADFRTSFHHDEHAGCAFREVASRLATTSSSSSSDYAASAVKISVIGGSWTAGNHCGDKELGGKKACAWPARLERLLHADGYTNFRVNNAAVPAWAYSNWIESGQLWGLAQSDIVIVDLNVNAQRYITHALDVQHDLDELLFLLLTARPELPVLAVNSFRVCTNARECNMHCSAEEQGSVSVTFAEDNATFSTGWCDYWWKIADLEAPIFRHYGISTASYRDAVWADLPRPNPNLPCFWNGNSHGDAVSHILVSDVVHHALTRTLALAAAATPQGCPPPTNRTPFHPHLLLTSCSARWKKPLTHLSTESPKLFTPLFHTDNWEFRDDASHGGAADTAKKLGWIFAGAEENSIAFRVSVSAVPRVEITFLQTYEGIGLAVAELYAASASDYDYATSSTGGLVGSPLATLLLDGLDLDPNHYSLPFTAVLPVDDLAAGRYTLVVRANATAPPPHAPKFKLLGITSC